MDSTNLIVVDKTAENADRINSLLRNSGIKVHIIQAGKSAEVKQYLDHESPLALIYIRPDQASASLEEIHQLSHQYGVPLALYSDLDDADSLIESLRKAACLVIHSENEKLLTDCVSHLLARHEQGKAHGQQRDRLEELEHRFDLLLDSARDAIAYIHEGLHVYANRAYLDALHLQSTDEVSGLSLLEMMKPEKGDLKSILRKLSNGDFPPEALQVSVSRPDGSEFEAGLMFSAAKFNGEECIQMLVHKLDATTELQAELDRLRITDPVTRFGNRRAFVDKLDSRLEEPHTAENVSAVIYLEPDGLEELLSELDVAALDELTADQARVLRSCLGENDFPARISDHGFAVLTCKRNMEEVEAYAEGLLKAFRAHLSEIGERSISLTCSIGIATLGRLARNSTEVLAGARKAQTEAAANGNQAIVFRPQLTAVSSFQDDRQWVDRIKYALSNDDLYAVHQPIVDLDGEGEHLVENLVYLRDEAGNLAPEKFMAIADRNDLAGTIDRQLIPELLKHFAESPERQIVSISANSVLDYSFPGWLLNQMESACVEGKKLIVQVSATTAQANLKPVQRLMQELAPMGCLLSISSFNGDRRCSQLLEHLDASYLKLSSSLTESLVGNTGNQEVIRGIVELAERHQVTVIADEVADTSSLAILWQCGIKLIAGAFLKESSQVVAQ
ncbi:MAG TPA: EAL domain-containing protein [Xanthomonadales bacterium]|nr:EAL domain-containing protein [Xanthomonadales bacterium]